MSGIRTNAAAELLGVSPNTLRSWERRFGYPSPRRSAGGHRQYELGELEALRRALLDTHNISSAIQLAQQRGDGPSSASRLLDAFDRFDDAAADRVMEESLAVRSVERSVEDIMLPALTAAGDRVGREAEWELGRRWATGWLHAARRVVPTATRPEGVLLFEAGPSLTLESLHVQALELALRRAGFRLLLLSASLAPERLARAMRALGPTALVLCGTGATLDVVGRIVYGARQLAIEAPVFEYRDAMSTGGGDALRSLGFSPTDATARLKALLDGRPGGAELEPGFGRRPVRAAS